MSGARKLTPKKLPFKGNVTPRLRLYLQACVAIGRKFSNKSPPESPVRGSNNFREKNNTDIK